MKHWTPEELAERRAAFDVEADRIAEAIEMSEISLNAITGEAMRAHGTGVPVDVPRPVIVAIKRKSKPAPKARTAKHGTSNMYNRHKCRCDKCKAFRRDKSAADREAMRTAKRRQKFIDRVRYIHGRDCKCPECIRREVAA